MISSTSNARVKRLVNLMKKRKARDAENVYLVEGIRMFREVPQEELREVYVSESFYGKEQDMVRAVLRGSRVEPEIVTDVVYEHISDTKSPQGILCVVHQKAYTLEEVMGVPLEDIDKNMDENAVENGVGGAVGNTGEALATVEDPHTIVLEHLQDPGNLGTIFRTAEAAGVSGIILDRGCVDIYNPKTIRSTMGAIYRVPFVYVEDLHETIKILKERNIRVYAAHLKDSVDYDEPDYTGGTAFLIGNEGNGLKKETADLADSYVKIPMAGSVESLNAAVAATILMFEVSRQRRHR